ncbi:hybrid-cluster NAD(P)-dependent oxidoreductase [Leeia aquatica]|uniref:Hybrid-cluster NAD(P)-dependent oxidoreductase n=1 Tax=Leeia aquatica TaxID=2725557 RepID=A0A847RVK1_9NEIS|nr:hybrid-cluster NAD(P)-dependent oxidoreductase [Leeia aquatica]NLR73851.1 hybrid-cluster NAD(P)-dependent oxidoreductase [Leeia aquatica]
MAAAPLPDFNMAEPALWQPGTDDTLECVLVRDETHDVKTFVFRSQQPRRFRYLPGQFITLELEINGAAINRCYTLSSTPTRPDTVSITVKRVPNGPVSNWLHDHMQVGQTVKVLGPSGEFSCFLHDRPKYLFLSAGSGITPLMSMSRALTDLVLDRDVVFVHSARSPADVIFAREQQALARNNPSFRHAVICERAGADRDYAGYQGFLSLATLSNIAPDFREREVFTCGPAPYMAAVRKILEAAGFNMQQYHEESFAFETLMGGAEEAQPPAAAAGEGYTIRFAKSGDEVRCAPPQTILAAAKATGMRLASSCTQGLCGTCKTKMLSGQVDMKHAGGIRQREIDQGFILPCCSVPLSDVVLDR